MYQPDPNRNKIRYWIDGSNSSNTTTNEKFEKLVIENIGWEHISKLRETFYTFGCYYLLNIQDLKLNMLPATSYNDLQQVMLEITKIKNLKSSPTDNYIDRLAGAKLNVENEGNKSPKFIL